MKKILAFILLCSLIILSFSSCAYIKLLNCNNDSSNNQEKEEEKESNEEIKYPIELSKEDDIVIELIQYLEDTSSFIEYVPSYLGDKINLIKNGNKALNINYMGSDTYFVCAYYTEDYWPIFYFDAPKFTWVKYDSADKITEAYNNLTFVAGFQFNVASLATDIVSTEVVARKFHHYQFYQPVFIEGVNTSDPINFNDTFIELVYPNDSDVYLTTKLHGYRYWSIPIVYINDCVSESGYYIPVHYRTTYSNGTNYDVPLEYEFEEYYDELMSVMITDKYSVCYSNSTSFYGLIKLDDLVKIIKGAAEEEQS